MDMGIDEGVVRFLMPDGAAACVQKAVLATRTSFFAPLLEETGPSTYSDEDLRHLIDALSPGSRRALLPVLEILGSNQMPLGWQDTLLNDELLFHTFAVAHLLGASELLQAARHRAAAQEGKRLIAAIALIDAKADAAVLRIAADYGLDRLSPVPLLHAAAGADSVDAAKVLVVEPDTHNEEPGTFASVTPPVELKDARGRTALHVCAVHDNADIARVLIDASASIDALCDPPDVGDEEVDDQMNDSSSAGKETAEKKRFEGGIRTALHLAAHHNSVEVLQLLLDAKADVTCCVKGCQSALTPLHECATGDAARAARILAPLAAHRSAEEALKLDEVLAAPMDLENMPSYANRAEAKDKEAGTKVDDIEDDERPLEWARFFDPLNAKVGTSGATPLHFAAESDSAGVVAALLDANADPTLGDDQGDTPVHWAMMYGSPRALQAFLDHGANATLPNGSGELPLHLIAEFGPGGDEDGLSPDFSRRHFAKSLRAQEILIDYLRSSNRLDACLAHGATGDSGNTPLHSVARWDHTGAQHAVRLLVSAKASLEAKNAEGRTPLAIAVRRYGSERKVASLLRSLGAVEQYGQEDPLTKVFGGCVRPLQLNAGMTASSLEEALERELGGRIRAVGTGQPSTEDMEVEEESLAEPSSTQQPLLPLMETQ